MKQEFIQCYTKELNEKQKKVFEILVCPIVATNNINEIGMYLKEDKRIILSPQSYEGNLDEDMCDLSIAFYEILYGLKEGFILTQQSSVDGEERNLAGDTMNSFEFISKFSSDDKRMEWNETYHCLANFWRIPKRIGRENHIDSKSSSGRYNKTIESFNKGKRDFMDRFLLELQEKYNDCLNDLEELGRLDVKAHYLDGIYITNNIVEKYSIVEKESKLEAVIDPIIDSMMKKICMRAKVIVCDEKKCDELFEYFSKLNLFI